MKKRKKRKSEGADEGGNDCFRESLKILSLRAYSVKEVELKLRSRGFSEAGISDTIDTLKDYGYLNDLELTRTLIEVKFDVNGYGRRRVREYLLRRKIPSDLAGREIERKLSREISVERGVKLLLSKRRLSGKLDRIKRGKLLRFLAGRGFELEECKDIITEYGKMRE